MIHSDTLNMTRRTFLRGALAASAVLLLAPITSACSVSGREVTGTWYGLDNDGNLSTLEVNEDGTWLFNGRYAANGEWSETDSGTIVLSAPLVSIPFKLDGSGDERVLSFAGDDPTYGNAPAISRSTFYATEAARDGAVKQSDLPNVTTQTEPR